MIGVFITARLGSIRLPGKHLLEVKGKPLIGWLINRFTIAFREQILKNELKIFITTSVKPENKKFESIFGKSEVEVFFGSDQNIPLRHLECANKNDIDYIISIDGDDILCSTEATKLAIGRLLKGSKVLKTTGLPLGMNVSGYTRKFLKKSLSGKESGKLETGWGMIFDKNAIDIIEIKKRKDTDRLRMTLDYDADAEFFQKVISSLDILNVNDDHLIDNILAFEWDKINSHLNEIYWETFNKARKEENNENGK
jgi:spore coat polysaccharide biosynthesis protein SpsF (cytidylyltransferase family)